VCVASNVILVGHEALSFLFQLLTELAKLRRIEREGPRPLGKVMQYFVLYNHGYNFILSITAAAAADLKLFRRTQYRKTRYRSELASGK